MTMEGETFLSPLGQLYSCVARRLSLAPCMCECQTGSHWGGDLRIGENLLVKAVLEVPLAWFSICSRRVETRWGEMVCRMQIDQEWWNYSGAVTVSFCGSVYACVRVCIRLCDSLCLHMLVAVSPLVLTRHLFGALGWPKCLRYSVCVCRSELPSTPVCVCTCVYECDCVLTVG